MKSDRDQILAAIEDLFDAGKRIVKGLAIAWLESLDAQGNAARIVTTPAQQTEPLMTVVEVANYLRVIEQTIYTWAKDGSIPCLRPNGELRFRRSAIDEWMMPNGDRIKTAREKSNGVVQSPRSFLRPQKRSQSNGRV